MFFARAPHTLSERSVSTRELLRAEEEEEDDEGEETHHTPSATDSKCQNPPSVAASASASAAPPLKRLVPRDLPFHQSSNSLRVRHQSSRGRGRAGGTDGGELKFWYRDDWFHVLLRFRTIVIVLSFVAVWTSFLLLFAAVYVRIDGINPEVDCGLGHAPNPISYYAAFAFSLETTTTVGYGLPNGSNGFFESCPELQVAIYFQMLIGMFLNAFLLSFMFARLSRCEARAAQVLFSDKAIVNREVSPDGIARYVLSTRVYDADSMYPIVEAHVRLYAVKHRSMHSEEGRGVRYPIKMEPMRVSIPNDDYGALMCTSIPTCVSHHIDRHSPISPPSVRGLGPEGGKVKREFAMDPCGLDLREDDSYTGGRDGLKCAVCGETYGTAANLIQHIRYNQHTETHDGVPVIGSHRELDVESIFKNRRSMSRWMPEPNNDEAADEFSDDMRIVIDEPTPPWYKEYQRYMREANIEIICLMEAIDPIASGTFAAIQSYTIDDIIFEGDFAPCVLADRVEDNTLGLYRKVLLRFLRGIFVGQSAIGRSVKVDLDSFHETVKVGNG